MYYFYFQFVFKRNTDMITRDRSTVIVGLGYIPLIQCLCRIKYGSKLEFVNYNGNII